MKNLAMLFIEREFTDKIDFNCVIVDFIKKKARKVTLCRRNCMFYNKPTNANVILIFCWNKRNHIRGRHFEIPPRAAKTLATPLFEL